MSLGDRILQPILLRTLAHPQLHQLLQKRHDWWRRLRNKPHQVVVWLSLTDPYSYLLIQTLPQFAAQFEVQFIFKILPYQEPNQFFSYYLRDAWHLAQLHQLQFHHFHAPSQEQCFIASQLLLANRHLAVDEFLPLAKQVCLCLWEHQHQKLATLTLRFGQLSTSTTRKKLLQAEILFNASDALRPAAMHYQGLWFYGIEELNFLAQHLSQKGLNISQGSFVLDNEQHQGEQHYLINDPQQLAYIRAQKHELNYFFSFDNPLSYIYLVAVSQLCEYYQIKLHLKPVLLEDNISRPWQNRFEHLQDLAMMYHLQLNRHYILSAQGTAHCLALFIAAKQQDKALEMSILLLEAIWKNSQDLSYWPHIKQLSQSLHLTDSTLKTYLKQASWQSQIDDNTAIWQELDLPYVPSFYLQGERHISFCGAYRLWAIESALIDSVKEMPKLESLPTNLS